MGYSFDAYGFPKQPMSKFLSYVISKSKIYFIYDGLHLPNTEARGGQQVFTLFSRKSRQNPYQV